MIELTLIGAGHAHAFVLEAFARMPEPDVNLTVISESRLAAYSGSVPAWLAGQCRLRETQIDVAGLCQRAGARLIEQRAAHVNAAAREITLESGERLNFDLASFNVGATLRHPDTMQEQDDSALPFMLAMRPLSALAPRWQTLCARVDALPRESVQRVVSVGGGAAGCETLLAVLAELRARRPDVRFEGALLSADGALLPGAGKLPRMLLGRALRRAGVHVHSGIRGEALTSGGVLSQHGDNIAADIVLWATGAVGHEWLSESGLARDRRGFIKVAPTLEASGQQGIFAAGDCAAFEPALPKAGVYAVRMGPHLAANLRRASRHEPLTAWQPPRRVLALIGTGDGRAIASYGALGASGKWLWRAKKRIDERFIARFNPPFDNGSGA
ncbi:FAD-dependent oxidoreductase [Vreelandella subglaciescola]|uniref:Sulfide:quinone oxidoreductase n=1 Tax=Vreelandella subglaciescola TaxID=29571 RepID=A0A1M7G5Z5_9GAMM|nr:FAD-dependent oxidoreductase [Halomonas subglaciescola]SHM11377.1 sulfide:quinone oxidoreductase [Halomonas subglaciescola]